MKIAIMTQPLGHNYGGIMQAWALQQILRRMGHQPVIINRQPDKKNIVYKASEIGYRSIKKIIGKRTLPINFERHVGEVQKNTRTFIRENITISEELYSKKKLKEHFDDQDYDIVMVGSDQTWRPAYSPNIYNFFLDFLTNSNIKKIAYASSFGTDSWEFNFLQSRRCATLVKNFDYISVREKSGIKLCRQHLGVKAELTLDPTLLLDSSDYLKLIKNFDDSNNNGDEQLLYTYLLDRSPKKESIAREISKKNNLRIFSCQAEATMKTFSDYSLENYEIPPVTSWLAGFKQAAFVVTDSFHGIIFSIIFNKPFLAITNSQRGATRFTSLLEQLDLADRLIEEKNNFSLIPSLDIEWSSRIEKLKILRMQSLDFLSVGTK